MIDETKKKAESVKRDKVRKRYANRIVPDILYPAKKKVDFYDDEVAQRVAVYVRVSTDHIEQVTSYELQKNYYEEFVLKHPNWSLVKIYADATDIIGLKQNPTNGRRFSPTFFVYRAFSA